MFGLPRLSNELSGCFPIFLPGFILVFTVSAVGRISVHGLLGFIHCWLFLFAWICFDFYLHCFILFYLVNHHEASLGETVCAFVEKSATSLVVGFSLVELKEPASISMASWK